MSDPIKTLFIVPDGESCALRDILIGRNVVIDGMLYWFHGGNHSYNEGYLRRIPQMGEAIFSLDDMAQPVRIEEISHE